MNPARLAIEKNVITIVFTLMILIGGAVSFFQLGRLEDPEFTIKTAVVTTMYPGAAAHEVEDEVTEVLETEIQQLAQLKRLQSRSMRGLSIINVEMKDEFDGSELPQVWDELRRKVSAAQAKLPPGAGPSSVNDDYGDVYGIFFAVTGDGYSYAETKEVVDKIRKELLLVEDVAKVAFYGDQPECIYVEMSSRRMSQLGVSPAQIYGALAQKNLVNNSGRVLVGSEYIPIDLTGDFKTAEQLGSILIRGGKSGALIHLRDVAEIKRGYIDPPRNMLRFNGQLAIGLGVSITSDGNVVSLGRAVKKRLKELESEIPVGIEMNVITFQSDLVEKSVNGFLVNLAEAVIIVIVVLMIFMGLRSGLIIGGVLLLTIAAAFVLMAVHGINLQRVSLGALVLALGMLVDNAIVVTEGILVRKSRGMDSLEASALTVKQTALPLLGATAVAILAFAALGLSNNSAGEFCNSLFYVMLYSLLASWVLAVTVTPYICHIFLKPKQLEKDADPYKGLLFTVYKPVLKFALNYRLLTVVGMGGLLVISIHGFGSVKQSFFPSSTRPAFLVNYWLPQGTHIERTAEDLKAMEKYVKKLPGVKSVTAFIGQGGLRYYLALSPEFPNTAYGQLKVVVDDYRKIDELIKLVQKEASRKYPDALCFTQKFEFGPGASGKIRARFTGPDSNVLRSLAGKAKMIMRENPNARDIRHDWRQRVKVIRPVLAEAQAERNGLGPMEVAEAINESFSGRSIGVFRHGDDLLPIIARPPQNERSSVDALAGRQIWSPLAGRMIPLGQVVSHYETDWEDDIIRRRNRKRTIEAICDPISGTANELLAEVRPRIEAIELPPGYELEWGGEYEDSKDANESIFAGLPVTMILIVMVVIALFNAIRQPLIIFLSLPLMVIGVTGGLLATGLPMGFMAVLGFISLTGMLIKNAVVLIDQIDLDIREGKPKAEAIRDASISRVRPVLMAAVTTVLGMMPLLQDAFYSSMAVTIMGGLTFGTILTLIFIPVLYSLFFRAGKTAD